MMFAAPTVLIMASWNSLPGEPMFGVKRAFEQGLVFFVKPSYAAEASLNMQYTKRRMEEAKVLLAKNQSAEGLSYLSQQIKTTRVMIQRAPTQEKKREAAKQYITTLQGVSKELKKQQKKTRSVALNYSPKTTGTSQEQLQARLLEQLLEVQQMQAQLQSQMQQPQTQQLLALLAQQSQQLKKLQQQLNQPQQQMQVAQALETQIAESEAIQDQVDVVAPSSDDAVDTIQEEIEITIDDLEDLSDQADTIPDEIEPTITSVPTEVPTSTPTEEPTNTPTPGNNNNNNNNNNDNKPDKDNNGNDN